MKKLDSSSAVPLYRQLKDRLQADYIEPDSGYQVDQAIPPEPELMRKYGVSRITVRNAVNELVKEGYLQKIQGKGTFVSSIKAYPMHTGAGFSATCARMNMQPSTVVVDMKVQPASEEDRAFFRLKPGESVICAKRLRLGDGMPVLLERLYLPERFSYLTPEDLEGSFYGILNSAYGGVVNHGPNWIELYRVHGSDAELLHLEEGEAVIRMEEFGYDRQNEPLHRTELLVRPMFRFYLA